MTDNSLIQRIKSSTGWKLLLSWIVSLVLVSYCQEINPYQPWIPSVIKFEESFDSKNTDPTEMLSSALNCRRVQAFLETFENDQEFRIFWLNPHRGGNETFQGILNGTQRSLTVMGGCTGYQFVFYKVNETTAPLPPHTPPSGAPATIFQLGSEPKQKIQVGAQTACFTLPSSQPYDEFRPEKANHTFFGALMSYFTESSPEEASKANDLLLDETEGVSCVENQCYVWKNEHFRLLETHYTSGSPELEWALLRFLAESEGTQHESKVHGMLGHVYLNRETGAEELGNAVVHLWIASTLGEPLAQGTLGLLVRVLGEIYLFRLLMLLKESWAGLANFPESPEMLLAMATSFLHCGAAGGSFPARATLGFETFLGIGREANCEAAYPYYSQAAVQTLEKQPLLLTRVQDVDLANENQRFSPLEIKEEQKDWINMLAEKGDPNAMLQLGEGQLFGQGMEKNPQQAYQWFDKAAEQGVVKALARQGIMHWHGIGIEANMTIAKELLRRSCDLGDPEGCYQLGYLLSWGAKTGEANYTEAMSFFNKSAQSNFPDAIYFVGLMCYHGKGVPRNLTQAFEHIDKATRLGSQQGLNLKAIMQYQGLGTSKSCHDAMLSWRQLVNQGAIRMHLAPARKHFVAHNWIHSLIQYGMLAEEGHVTAQKNAAWMLLNHKVSEILYSPNLVDGMKKLAPPQSSGHQSLEDRDAKRSLDVAAERYYSMAAKQNDSESLFQLGNTYFQRWVQNYNPEHFNSSSSNDVLISHSFHFYMEAAKSCHAQSLFNLGSLYYNGHGVSKDFNSAIVYFKNASSCSSEAFFPSIIAILGIHLQLVVERIVNSLLGIFSISIWSHSFPSAFFRQDDAIIFVLSLLLLVCVLSFLFRSYFL
mmetsp:Transcript_27845/g.36044  ORF Transcript_27845/g.36044 Transcript_27845/m.36044 type:complete len:876 (+) Transcript_27845:121-2748(+)